jgi:hypothetical protein
MSICRKIAATALAQYFPVVEADLAEATLQSGRLTEQQALSRSELAEPRWRPASGSAKERTRRARAPKFVRQLANCTCPLAIYF